MSSTGKADVVTVYSMGEAALTYDVHASPCLAANMPELIAEVFGDAPYQYIRTKVDLDPAGPLRDGRQDLQNLSFPRR